MSSFDRILFIMLFYRRRCDLEIRVFELIKRKMKVSTRFSSERILRACSSAGVHGLFWLLKKRPGKDIQSRVVKRPSKEQT